MLVDDDVTHYSDDRGERRERSPAGVALALIQKLMHTVNAQVAQIETLEARVRALELNTPSWRSWLFG